MNLAERHIIKSNNKLFGACDREAFLSKNLHNATTYELRQAFFDKDKKMPSYKDLAGFLQNQTIQTLELYQLRSVSGL